MFAASTPITLEYVVILLKGGVYVISNFMSLSGFKKVTSPPNNVNTGGELLS